MSADFTTHGIGRTVGSYVLEEEIGRGGMGVVYRARRGDTGEVVALKLMLPEISASHHFRARFVREASLGSDLDHPNIVPIYDAGEADGELFIAMRLVEGRDLKSVLEQHGALDPKRVLAIMRQVASALDAAHEAGVVHHDVKPQNILVAEGVGSDKELVFVTDFGLVRPAGSESTASRTGQVFGSIQYMPPEQVEGLPADGRADVYALGCVLYECLTGKIPFDRPNEVAVLWAHVHEQPARVTDSDPSLPGGVDSVVATAMAKHPDDRYLTCGELIEELGKGLDRKHRPVVMPVMRPLVKRIPRRKTEREVWAPNFFPELNRVRKVSNRVNWIQVTGVTAILALFAAAFVQFAHPGGITGAVSDAALAVGDSVLSAGAKISSAFGGEDESEKADRPVQIDRPSRNAFSRGRTEVSTREGRQADAPRNSGQVSTSTDREGEAPQPVALGLRSRDFVFVSSRDGSFDVFRARANGSQIKQLTSGPASEYDPEFSPDGSRIVYSLSARQEELLACPTGSQCPYNSHIYVMNADGTEQAQVSTGSDVYDSDPTWSPDGKSIVFTRWAGDTNADLFILTENGDGTWSQAQLTSQPGSETEPAFSPDGSTIVYSGDVDTDTEWTEDEPHVWDLFSLDSSGVVERLTRAAHTGTPDWSPDGERIVFAGRNGVFVLGVAGGSITRLTQGDDHYTDWSEDGSKIAFTRCGDLVEKCRIMSYHVHSGKLKVVVDDRGDYDGMPAWGPAR